MNIEFPSQGVDAIPYIRKEVLDAFDSARQKAKTHEVEKLHGKVAEEKLREWLKVSCRSAMASLRGTLSLPA